MTTRTISLMMMPILMFQIARSTTIETCGQYTFWRRPVLNDNKFSTGLVEEIFDIEHVVHCVASCHMYENCNAAVYNSASKVCRLHSTGFDDDATGIPEPGWEYFGVSCGNYRIENGNVKPETKVNCDDGFVFLPKCPELETCYNYSTWTSFNGVCMSVLEEIQDVSLDPAASTPIDVNFVTNIQPGHVITIEATGQRPYYSALFFKQTNGDIPYHLSLRFFLVKAPEARFNFKIGGPWNTDVLALTFPFQDINLFTLSLYIGNGQIEAFGDGVSFMINTVSYPAGGINRIQFKGYKTLQRITVAEDDCTP